MPIIAAGILVAALVGGGVSLAANNSVPGDALYGVKVNVNENMHNAFAFSDKAKTQADLDEAKARIEEANKLSASGKLTADDQATLMANFDAHVQAASERIAHMRANGNTQDATTLSTQFISTLNGAINATDNTNDTTGTANGDATDVSGTANGSASATTNASLVSHVQSELSNFNSATTNGSSDMSGSAHTNTEVHGSANGNASDTNSSAELNGNLNVNANL